MDREIEHSKFGGADDPFDALKNLSFRICHCAFIDSRGYGNINQY